MPDSFLEAFINALADLDVDLEIKVDDKDKKTCDVVNDIAQMFSNAEKCDDVDTDDDTESIEELEKAVQPVLEWLAKYGNPYTDIVINSYGVRVTEDIIGIPANGYDDEE